MDEISQISQPEAVPNTPPFLERVKLFFRSFSKVHISLLALAIFAVVLPVTIIFLQQKTITKQYAAALVYTCNRQSGDASYPNNGYTYGASGMFKNGVCKPDEYCDSSGDDLIVPCKKISSVQCTCDQGENSKGGSFHCGDHVFRGCGATLYCNDKNGGHSQSGLWPCVSSPDPTKTQCEIDGGKCQLSTSPCSGTIIKSQCMPGPGISCCKPSTQNYCQYAAKGNGGYCGSVLGHGANTNHVYVCTNQKTTSDTNCSNGCVINSSGSDYCKGSGGGGGNGCTKGKDTKLALSIKLEGIGTGQFENNNPLHPNRSGKIRVYDTASPSKNVHNSSQTLNHGKSNGKFESTTVDVGKTLACSATYKVELKLPRYLPATAEVKYGETSQTVNLQPLPGDVNEDGKIDVNDYSIYRQCHDVSPTTMITLQSGSTTVKVACSDLINFFDFQDGGTSNSSQTSSGIGEWDANYNLWLRSYVKVN